MFTWMISHKCEQQPGAVVIGSLTLFPGLTPSRAHLFLSLLTPLMYLTSGAGAVDDKDLTISSDQGNA